MHDQLVKAVQDTLTTRWGDRLPVLLAKAKNFAQVSVSRFRATPPEMREPEVGRLVREAYMTGYRQGYMDALVDFIEGTPEDPREHTVH